MARLGLANCFHCQHLGSGPNGVLCPLGHWRTHRLSSCLDITMKIRMAESCPDYDHWTEYYNLPIPKSDKDQGK